jgi:hypothetical protein
LSDPIPACQQIWSKPLSGPQPRSIALLFINYASEAVNITCNTSCLWHAGILSNATARDLWLHKGALKNFEFMNEMKRIRYLLANVLPSDVGTVSDSFTSSVGANGASNTYKLTPV